MKEKPLIVWDFDDVLYPLMDVWFSRYGMSIQSALTRYDQLSEFPPHDLMGVPLSRFGESLVRFRDSSEGQAIKPKTELSVWFTENGQKFRHGILTARPRFTEKNIRSWIQTHFPVSFEMVEFVNSENLPPNTIAYFQYKRRYLEDNNIHCRYFIDDVENSVLEVAKITEVNPIVFPQPWNSAWNDRRKIKYLLPQG